MLVVCARACLLWLLRVDVFRNRRVICPCQWAPQVLWSIFDRRLCVSGAFLFFWWRFGNADFDELRAGLSSSHVTALLFVGGAAYSARCFVVARALCLLL